MTGPPYVTSLLRSVGLVGQMREPRLTDVLDKEEATVNDEAEPTNGEQPEDLSKQYYGARQIATPVCNVLSPPAPINR